MVLQHNDNISTGHVSALDPGPGRLDGAGHTVVAVVLGVILVLGFLGNFLVLVVFSRFPVLRTQPVNLLLINISASDMLVCIFGTPFSFAASVRGRWLTGSYGCQWYGFSNALFGLVSLVSLSLLSYERYSVLLRSTRSDRSQPCGATLAVAASWFYSLSWSVPPLLGWSSYGPEGPGTTCSVQWSQRSVAARSYVSCLFIFCLLLPLLLMLFCYGRILLAVRQITRIDQSSAGRREGRVLLMVVSMVTGYLVCWLPYGVVAMLSSFGRPGLVTPAASLIPSLLAKTSTVLNPVIYVLLNNQFSRCFLFMIRCQPEAPPTTIHHTLPSSRDMRSQNNTPTQEHTPGLFTSTEQRAEQSSPGACGLQHIGEVKGHK